MKNAFFRYIFRRFQTALEQLQVTLKLHHIVDFVRLQAGIIVTDLATMYQGESFYPDMLRFEVGLMDFNKYGGDFVFRVTKADSGQPVALAKYGFVFFNYQSREVTPMPESFRARFA